MLDLRPPAEAIEVLSALAIDSGAAVLRRMSPGSSRRVLEESSPDWAASLISRLPFDAAAPLLRRVSSESRERLLASMPEDIAEGLRAAIGFPENTAGALMDPHALALHGDVTVEEALSAIAGDSEHALYNVYVTSRDGVLTGVLNLLELLSAPPRHSLDMVARPALHRLSVHADRQSIVSHEGWQKVYSLPVVDGQDNFVGALRYRTVRRLETELANPEPEMAGATSSALGELFRTGIVGMIDALSGGFGPGSSPADGTLGGPTREEAAHGDNGED